MTTTSSISGTDNNNAVMFFENVSSSVAGLRDHREASIMLPINNNNAGVEIIYISDDEEPDLESSLLESRSAIQHLPNGDSVRELEELLILDYSNLVASIEEEEDANLRQYEPLGDGQRVTNPNLGLTETEVAVCIGREIFQTVGEQPQNIDACGICQEDYVHGEELGRLDCAHRYHLSCIRQWLLIKNRCPVCKKMALTIIDLEDDEEHTMNLF